ncbi:hypothetical protein Glove_54g103 [Diversispora epigaea]|uniref:Protein kinase domain-containing protein n=1 Tax=Diversispora epigaea TaxID=1348612 RepID=A0A397JG05_9GLOM|nr:hypothetical protein Glove_54g103 [Diversispora epigaea]
MNSRASSSKETKCSAVHSTSDIGYEKKKISLTMDIVIFVPKSISLKSLKLGPVGTSKLIRYWDLNESDWDYCNVGNKVALKEINDSKDDVSIFIKEVQNIQTVSDLLYVTICLGISKNPSTQNFIIVMELYDNSLHKFLKNDFWKLRWELKLFLLYNTAWGFVNLHKNDLVHCDLHAGNILTKSYSDFINSNLTTIADFGSCSLENDSILKSNNKSNKIYGSIPYIPPEVLRGNTFTKKGDIYSFGGVMYKMVTGKQPFYDRAHDTRLIIDILWRSKLVIR